MHRTSLYHCLAMALFNKRQSSYAHFALFRSEMIPCQKEIDYCYWNEHYQTHDLDRFQAKDRQQPQYLLCKTNREGRGWPGRVNLHCTAQLIEEVAAAKGGYPSPCCVTLTPSAQEAAALPAPGANPAQLISIPGFSPAPRPPVLQNQGCAALED